MDRARGEIGVERTDYRRCLLLAQMAAYALDHLHDEVRVEEGVPVLHHLASEAHSYAKLVEVRVSREVAEDDPVRALDPWLAERALWEILAETEGGPALAAAGGAR